jgi:hypothetical protein|tara:strand:+ start:1973 stop:2479 length:507 start_codon:yes stop_codon:yes gene_type:complete
MLKISHKFKVDWDFEGYPSKSPYTQKDWNQTLHTKINLCSAHIHKVSMRGGGDTIRLNNRIFNLLETLEYYNLKGDGKLKGFEVVIDDLILEDVIYVYNAKNYRERFVPKIKQTKTSITNTNLNSPLERNIETAMGEITFELGNDKEIKKYRKSLVSKITILNYDSKT